MDIKEESYFPDFCSEKKADLVKKVKIETVRNSSDIKQEPQEDSACCSQNEEHDLMRLNETIKESEIETKIYIKEEDRWLETMNSCINDDIKDETHEDFHSTELPSYTLDLFSTEDLANDSFDTNQNGPERGSGRKYLSQEGVSTDISSTETRVCLEISDDQKILKSHKCNICGKPFTQLSDLKRHEMIHDGIKPYKCNICNKAFTQFSNLKTHKRIHEGIKPHTCNICNKAFTQLSHLKTHKRIHEGIKPYKCNICNKAFTQLPCLKKHYLVHQGIKPHKCNICNKAFTDLSNLTTHKFIHEGIKPHKCNICNKAFTHLSSLKTHKLSHQGIKPHKCNLCNKAFTHLSNLKRHILIHQDI